MDRKAWRKVWMSKSSSVGLTLVIRVVLVLLNPSYIRESSSFAKLNLKMSLFLRRQGSMKSCPARRRSPQGNKCKTEMVLWWCRGGWFSQPGCKWSCLKICMQDFQGYKPRRHNNKLPSIRKGAILTWPWAYLSISENTSRVASSSSSSVETAPTAPTKDIPSCMRSPSSLNSTRLPQGKPWSCKTTILLSQLYNSIIMQQGIRARRMSIRTLFPIRINTRIL